MLPEQYLQRLGAKNVFYPQLLPKLTFGQVFLVVVESMLPSSVKAPPTYYHFHLQTISP